MAPPPRALPEELIVDILLRFPPHEPAGLVRASLVCKRWCRLVSGLGFRRRFREFHRTPPILGFLLNVQAGPARFVPTAASCLPHDETRSWRVLDARHGRVLFQRQPADPDSVDLIVWDLVTSKEQREVPGPSPRPSSRGLRCMAAAVLCSVTTTGACDHLDCHRTWTLPRGSCRRR
jgi:hypothetical protein